MKYLKLDANAKLDDLAAIAYRLKERTPASVREQAITALLAANPRLASGSKVPKDTVVVIPEVAGLKPDAKAATPSSLAAVPFTMTARDAKSLIEHLRKQAATHAEQQQEAIEALKSREARTELKALGDPAAELIKTATAAVKARSKQDAVRIERKEKALQRMLTDLDDLRARFGGG
jgi:hypothetical protein